MGQVFGGSVGHGSQVVTPQRTYSLVGEKAVLTTFFLTLQC